MQKNIKTNSFISRSFLCAAFTLGLFLSVTVFSRSVYAAFNISVGSNGAVDLGEIMPTPSSGALSNVASDNVLVTTNCSTGYSIYATGINGGGTSLVDAKHSGSIATSSNMMTSPAPLAANTWGLVANRLSADSGNFSGLPAYTTDVSSIFPVYVAGTSPDTIRNDNIPVYYGVKVDTGTKPGNYSVDVLYTVLMSDNCLRYTLKFDSNGATTNTLQSQTIDFGERVNLSELSSADKIARTGYTLSGWKTKINGAISNTTYATTAEAVLDNGESSEVTLVAQWTINSHTATINKGTGVSSVSGSGSYDYNSTVPISATMNSGYHFVSWTVNSGGINAPSGASTSFAMPDKDVTLTANGAANTYTVSYSAGSTGGTCSVSSTSATYDQNVTLSSTKCTKTGYTQDGWSTGSSASNTKTYNLGQALTKPNFVSSNNGSYTLYPHFTINSHTVTVNKDAGIASVAGTGTYNYGQTVTISASPSADYVFSSWTVNSGGISTPSGASTSFTMPDTNVVITANSKVKVVYTVTFNKNGGNSVSSSSKTVVNGEAYGTLPTAKRNKWNGFESDGWCHEYTYTFNGWYTTKSSGGVQITADTIVDLTGNQTLYARWKSKQTAHYGSTDGGC